MLPWDGCRFLSERIEEPDRFTVAEVAAERPRPGAGRSRPSVSPAPARGRPLAFAISVITGPATSFVFLYAQDVLHQPGYVTAAMVAVPASGIIGLLAGRWLADHLGPRGTASSAMVAMALCGVITYSGSPVALFAGYGLAVLAGSVLAPAAGSLLAELFPTSVRASVTGWWVVAGVLGAGVGLVAFGGVADVGDRFGFAATLTFLPTALAAGLSLAGPRDEREGARRPLAPADLTDPLLR